MRTILLAHVLAGGLGLLVGYVALAASKGTPLHRKNGLLFVYVMTTMSVTGMIVSGVGGVAPAINIPAAALTSYLVITSLTTVRPAAARSRPLDIAGMLFALVLGLACIALGFAAIARGGPGAGAAFPIFMFGVAALLASAGDRRMIRAGGLRGAPRLKRHLWRMCFALFIASIAFYTGRGRVPEMFRIPALLAGAVMLPIVAMLYWKWRLRRKRVSRAVVGVTVPEAI
jgi:uncharacterized membrane protein